MAFLPAGLHDVAARPGRYAGRTTQYFRRSYVVPDMTGAKDPAGPPPAEKDRRRAESGIA